MPAFVWIIIVLVLAVAGFFGGTMYRKKVAEREISSAEDEAKRIIPILLTAGTAVPTFIQTESLLPAFITEMITVFQPAQKFIPALPEKLLWLKAESQPAGV